MTHFETVYEKLKKTIDLESTYLGWIRRPNSTQQANKSALIDFFRGNQKFKFSTGCNWEEGLTVRESNIKQISPSVAVQTLCAIINEAVRYASSTSISESDAELLAKSFLSDFDNPSLFANCEPNLVGGNNVTRDTQDWAVFAIDSKSIGFLITVNGE